MYRSNEKVALIVTCLLFSLSSCGNLYGIWDSPNFSIEIYSANQTDGSQLSQLFQNQTLATFFGYPITSTSSKSLVFVSLLNGNIETLNSTIAGFDFSDPTSVTQKWEFMVPLDASLVQYVPSLNRLYVGGYYEPVQPNATTSNFTMGYVDLKHNVYHQLVVFSRLFTFPSFGSCFAFVPSKNLFVLSMMTDAGQNFYLITVHAITGKVTVIPQPSFYAQALIYDPTSKNVYAILTSTSFNVSNDNLYWGTVDVTSGTYNVITQWNQPSGEFVFVIEGIITADFEKKVAYSIIGDGAGPPVAYVSIDMQTGDFLGAHYYQNQPQFIFYLSDD